MGKKGLSFVDREWIDVCDRRNNCIAIVSLGNVGCIVSLIDVGCVVSWVVGAVREPPLRGVSVTSPRGVSVNAKIPCR
jgi:hypothetical protein